MPVAGGGFEQAYNAQALVAADSLLVVTNDVVQAPNDKRQIDPALEALARHPEAMGASDTHSRGQRLLQRGQRERLRLGRDRAADHARLVERHHLSWNDRFAVEPPPPENSTPLEAMTHRLATPEGRQLYAPAQANAENRCFAA